MNDLDLVRANDDELVIKSVSANGIVESNPYIEFNDLNVIPYKNYSKIYSLVSVVILAIILYKFVKLKTIYTLFVDLLNSRKLIFELAKNDFKTKYSGSYFGVIWSFIQPVCTILVFWFVFQVGFRSNDIGNIPYILWFLVVLFLGFSFLMHGIQLLTHLQNIVFWLKKLYLKCIFCLL